MHAQSQLCHKNTAVALKKKTDQIRGIMTALTARYSFACSGKTFDLYPAQEKQ